MLIAFAFKAISRCSILQSLLFHFKRTPKTRQSCNIAKSAPVVPTSKPDLLVIYFLAYRTPYLYAQTTNPTRLLFIKAICTYFMLALLFTQLRTHFLALLTDKLVAFIARDVVVHTSKALYMLANQFNVFEGRVRASFAFKQVVAVNTEAALDKDAFMTVRVLATLSVNTITALAPHADF